MNNPYSAPAENPTSSPLHSDVNSTFSEIARTTFIAWEKMRLMYFAICATVSLAFGAISEEYSIASTEFWALAIGGGLAANVFYLAGPMFETYVTWLGVRSIALRWGMFLMGTLFTVLMAMLLLLGTLIP